MPGVIKAPVYNEVAKRLAELDDVSPGVVSALADLFEESNPRFDRERFVRLIEGEKPEVQYRVSVMPLSKTTVIRQVVGAAQDKYLVAYFYPEQVLLFDSSRSSRVVVWAKSRKVADEILDSYDRSMNHERLG